MATPNTSCAEGIQEIDLNGDPATFELALVLKALAVNPAAPGANELNAASVFADLTEVSWSGSTPYARISVPLPAPVTGVWTVVTQSEWNTGSATNGPISVPTIAVLLPTTPRKLLGLWDASYLLRGGALTQLNGGVTLPTGTITVDSAANFPASGTVHIGNSLEVAQVVAYTGKTATTLTGCTGGSGAVADNTLVRLPCDMSVVNARMRMLQPYVLYSQAVTVTL